MTLEPSVLSMVSYTGPQVLGRTGAHPSARWEHRDLPEDGPPGLLQAVDWVLPIGFRTPILGFSANAVSQFKPNFKNQVYWAKNPRVTFQPPEVR